LDAAAAAGPAALGLATLALLVHAVLLACVVAALSALPGTERIAPTRAEALVASNACIGGPSTAAAFAVALDRGDLVVPAVVWGTVGYAVATSLGVALHPLLLRWSASWAS